MTASDYTSASDAGSLAANSAPEDADRSRGRSGGVFLLTSLAVFLVSLDVSIANAVLPAMGASFGHPNRAALSWVLTVYAITFAAALVPAGRLADRAGRRRVFAWGLLAFGVGSVVCGASPNLPIMLLGRVLQALGAATAQPASLGLLVTAVPVRRRATYVARWGGMGAVGIGLGPSLGGFITASSSWRWAFLVNVPLIIVALFYTPRFLVETPRHPGRRIPDPVGAVLLAGAAAVLTLGISETSTWGAESPRTVGLVVGGCALGGLFAWRSVTVTDPVLDLKLLRRRRTALVTIVTVFYSAGFFGLLFTFVLFLTGPWHLSLSKAGIALTPMPATAIVVITFVGALSDKVGFRLPLATGTACMSAGLLVSVLVDHGHAFSPVWVAVVAFIGFGVGLCYPLLSAAAVADEPAEHLAAATAVNQCARQIGAALGIAATVAAVGPAPTAPVVNFHSAWIACATFTAAASIAALGLPRGGLGAVKLPPSIS